VFGVRDVDRIILHSDCNSFYASAEYLHRPEILISRFFLGGGPEQRHGIILTQNEQAKKYGIKPGEALWQTLQECPDLGDCTGAFCVVLALFKALS
jgi:DNA polymerase-4